MSEQENKGKLNIELPEEVATGVYANLAVITHSPAEFVMDFIQVMPGMPKAAPSIAPTPGGPPWAFCFGR